VASLRANTANTVVHELTLKYQHNYMSYNETIICRFSVLLLLTGTVTEIETDKYESVNRLVIKYVELKNHA